MLVFPGGAELVKARKFFFALGIKRLEADALARQPRYATARKNADAEIDGDRAGMKEIERPDVRGSAGEVDTTGCMHDDGSVVGQVGYSVKKRAIWRNLL